MRKLKGIQKITCIQHIRNPQRQIDEDKCANKSKKVDDDDIDADVMNSSSIFCRFYVQKCIVFFSSSKSMRIIILITASKSCHNFNMKFFTKQHKKHSTTIVISDCADKQQKIMLVKTR